MDSGPAWVKNIYMLLYEYNFSLLRNRNSCIHVNKIELFSYTGDKRVEGFQAWTQEDLKLVIEQFRMNVF